jgi:hypothetical protein
MLTRPSPHFPKQRKFPGQMLNGAEPFMLSLQVAAKQFDVHFSRLDVYVANYGFELKMSSLFNKYFLANVCRKVGQEH